MATFWPKHGPIGPNFDDFFDYFGLGVGGLVGGGWAGGGWVG